MALGKKMGYMDMYAPNPVFNQHIHNVAMGIYGGCPTFSHTGVFHFPTFSHIFWQMLSQRELLELLKLYSATSCRQRRSPGKRVPPGASGMQR